MEKKQRINKISDISDRSDRTVRRETASVKNRKRSVSHGKKKRRQKQNRAGRLIQCGLILALFLVLFYVVRNFGEANKFNNKGIEAYEQAMREGYYGTDDASLVEHYGGKVKIVEGSYENIKVTTPEDIVIGEALLRQGSDVHGYMK